MIEEREPAALGVGMVIDLCVSRLRQRTASILKWEGIVNDPVGALLAVVLFEYFTLTDGSTHPAWVLMYLMMVVSQLVFAAGYVLAPGSAA